MLNPKFMLRVLALMVMSLWAQSASALVCDPVTGTPGGNTAAESFANAKQDTCGGASFGTGPAYAGHVFYADEFGVGVQFILNGVSFTPAAKSLSCLGAQLIHSWSGSSIQASFPSSTPYATNCLLTYTDANGYTVSHSFGASTSLLGGVLVGELYPSTVTTGWFERDRPTVSLTGLPSTIGDTPQWVTITFSEPVYGFDFTDINLAFAFILDFTAESASEYRIQIKRGASASPVSISVPANGAADIVGNLNLASNTLTATVDATPPTVTLTGLSAAVGPAPQTITATFSEDVTGFTLADVDAPLMTLSNFTTVSASVYTFDLSNGRSVAVSVQIPAASAVDLTGNANTASNTLTASADPTPPSVWITGLPATIFGPVTFDATINFSEDVTGFEQAEINISGGVITAFSGSGAIYTATVSANGVDDLVMSVSANVAQDAALNFNDASGTATSENVVAEQTSAAISQFMLTRANALLANQPDLAGLLRGGAGPVFGLEATLAKGMLTYQSGSDGPLWVQLDASWANNTGAQSSYLFGVVGGHSKISENLLIGGMVQFDTMFETNGATTLSGTGWMIGPYFVAKLPDQPLYIEGALLYGQTRNEIFPNGSFTDRFSTERWLATLGISGQIERGSLTLVPFLDAKYTSDAQAAYLDGLGNPIVAQTIGLAQVSAGLDFETALTQATMLNGGVSGVWSYSSGSAITPGFEGGRARIDLGLNHQLGRNGNLAFGGFYDGIGTAGFESYGLEIGFTGKF